jgi:hypothetical protein
VFCRYDSAKLFESLVVDVCPALPFLNLSEELLEDWLSMQLFISLVSSPFNFNFFFSLCFLAHLYD